MEGPIGQLVLCVAAVLYLLPTFVASQRRHRNKLAIFVLNLSGGWTLAGWVVALTWACTDYVETRAAGGA